MDISWNFNVVIALKIKNVIIETDAKAVVDSINGKFGIPSIDLIIQDYRCLMQKRQDIIIFSVGRTGIELLLI